MNRLSIGAINFVASLTDCPLSRLSNSAYVLQVSVKVGRQLYSDLDRFVIVDGAEFELGHPCHPLYGSSTRSRLTITRTGNPGRIVSVGWMFKLRRTACCPV